MFCGKMVHSLYTSCWQRNAAVTTITIYKFAICGGGKRYIRIHLETLNFINGFVYKKEVSNLKHRIQLRRILYLNSPP